MTLQEKKEKLDSLLRSLWLSPENMEEALKLSREIKIDEVEQLVAGLRLMIKKKGAA